MKNRKKIILPPGNRVVVFLGICLAIAGFFHFYDAGKPEPQSINQPEKKYHIQFKWDDNNMRFKDYRKRLAQTIRGALNEKFLPYAALTPISSAHDGQVLVDVKESNLIVKVTSEGMRDIVLKTYFIVERIRCVISVISKSTPSNWDGQHAFSANFDLPYSEKLSDTFFIKDRSYAEIENKIKLQIGLFPKMSVSPGVKPFSHDEILFTGRYSPMKGQKKNDSLEKELIRVIAGKVTRFRITGTVLHRSTLTPEQEYNTAQFGYVYFTIYAEANEPFQYDGNTYAAGQKASFKARAYVKRRVSLDLPGLMTLDSVKSIHYFIPHSGIVYGDRAFK